MTHKLYYENSYLKKFKAEVLQCVQNEKTYDIELNETCFYPGGGGQPVDKGWLNRIEVIDVREENGKIYHKLDRPLEVGSYVEGEIDFERRFDYMQQHSGEHMLSGVIHKLYNLNNVGFHLSDLYMTADFDGMLSLEELKEVEYIVNRYIFKNLSIKAETFPHTMIKDIMYRSKLDLEGDIRLVEVKECDVCACCGTHVKTTGEIGILKIVDRMKYKKGMRLTILCGERARRDYGTKLENIKAISTKFSVKPDDVLIGIQRLEQEVSETKALLQEYTEQYLRCEALKYKGYDHICIKRDDLTFDQVRKLCLYINELQPSTCLITLQDKETLKYILGSSKEDVRPTANYLNTQFQGKGGGNSKMCQGNLKVDFDRLKEYLATHSIF